MNVIIYENKILDSLKPFMVNHSPVELRIGAFTNFERIKNLFNDEDKLFIIVRKDIEGLIKDKFPTYDVNPDTVPEGICLNSSAIFMDTDIDLIKKKQNLSTSNQLISFYLNKKISLIDFYDVVNDKSEITIESNIKIINNMWDIFDMPEQILENDYKEFLFTNNYNWHHSLIKINEDKVFIGNNCTLKAGVILDASIGPIIIDENVTIEHHVSIKGPVYIGKGSLVSSGSKIKENTIIGPVCKVGGEISHCNFLGYSNKVHEGFLGHSYVGEWVNIGAGTNNSNLKNNYSNIRIIIDSKEYDTQKQFLGTLIGDYTRIAIGTTINTGTYLSIGSNIFNHEFSCKYMPAFSWGLNERVIFNKFIDSILKMKNRRNKKITLAEMDFLETLYKNI